MLSTVNVAANGLPPTIPELREVLSDSVEIDRTQINAWEDVEFRQAVEATGRKKLIMTALWTEVCLAFPSLDALRAGYEVFPGSSTPWVEPLSKPIEPVLSGSSRAKRSRSAGCPWRANCNATGPGLTPSPKWWTSCSPLDLKKGSEPLCRPTVSR